MLLQIVIAYFLAVRIILSKNLTNHRPDGTITRQLRGVKNVKKLELVANTVVHVDHSVFLEYKNFFESKFVIDKDDDAFVEAFLTMLYTHIMQSVSRVYSRFTNPFFKLEIRLIDVKVQTKPPKSIFLSGIPWHDPRNSGYTFNFSIAQSYFTEFYLNSNLNIAHTAMITRFKIKEIINGSGDVLGVASIGGICGKYESSSINLDQDYMKTVHTISHEIGHSLGADHDKTNEFLMGSTYHVKDTALYLSSFTVKQMFESYFGTGTKPTFQSRYACLLPNNTQEIIHPYVRTHSNLLLGHVFSQAYQCKLGYANFTYSSCHYLNDDEIYEPSKPCKVLKCSGLTHKNNDNDKPNESKTGLYDGTPCGPNKICMLRECVENKVNPIPEYALTKLKLCPFSSYENEDDCQEIAKTKKLEVKLCSDPFYRARCCQTCIKNEYNKCNNRGKIEKPHSKHLITIEFLECDKTFCKFVNYKDTCKLPRCENLRKNPCFNGGSCKTNKTTLKLRNRLAAFDCVCPLGYSGPLCLDHKPCSIKNICPKGKRCVEIGDLGHHMCIDG